MSEEKITAPYIDDLNVREQYAELVQTIFGDPGMVRIEFCLSRWTNEAPVHKRSIVPVGRVAIHLGLAQILRDQLTACLELAAKREQFVAPPASPMKN